MWQGDSKKPVFLRDKIQSLIQKGSGRCCCQEKGYVRPTVGGACAMRPKLPDRALPARPPAFSACQGAR